MNNYLKGIKDSDPQVLKEIYDKFYPTLKTFILKNSGSEDDAKDCFQEALIATFRRLQRQDFEISTTFNTYIFNVGKYIWFKVAKKRMPQDSIEDFKHGELGEIDMALEGETKYVLFKKGIKSLGEDCQTILGHYFAKKKFKEIAILMDYSVEYARRKKLLCTKSLMKIIKADPLYKELYN